MNKNPFLGLKDKKISAIVFILDYLQIQFDNSILTFVVYPTVEINTINYSFGESEYRNKICEFIGENVSNINYIEDDLFCVMCNGANIYCSIKPEDYVSPEMIIFDDGEGQTAII